MKNKFSFIILLSLGIYIQNATAISALESDKAAVVKTCRGRASVGTESKDIAVVVKTCQGRASVGREVEEGVRIVVDIELGNVVPQDTIRHDATQQNDKDCCIMC